jgi:hypothetical protein
MGTSHLCDKCKAILDSGWYGEAVWSQDGEDGDIVVTLVDGIDEPYIKQLRERRMRSFKAARRMAGR